MHVLSIFAAASALTFAGPSEQSIKTVRVDAHGEPTGVILEDGTELVGTAKEKDLKRVAIPGDPVRITGDADESLVLVNGRTHETIKLGAHDRTVLKPLVVNPIGIGGGPMATDSTLARFDDAAKLDRYAVTARVALVLKTHVGAPSGLLLDDGTQVHVIPRFSGALSSIKPGMQLRIEGVGTPRQRDASMWALSISRDDFVYLDLERGDGAPELNVAGPFEEE